MSSVNALVPYADPNTPQHQAIVHSHAPFPGVGVGGGTAPQHHVGILKLLHRQLRGRYLIAAILAILGGGGGGIAGYLSQTPKYKCDGLVRIRAVMPTANPTGTDYTQTMPMLNSYVNTQANLLQHPRVIAKAMGSDDWRSLKRGTDPLSERNFRASLRVNTSHETPELIFVSFTDIDPRAAKIGLDEVLRAYNEIFGRAEVDVTKDARTTTLVERRQGLVGEIKVLESSIQRIAQEFGTDDLSRRHDFLQTQSLELDQKIADIDMRTAGFSTNARTGAQPGTKQPDEPGVVPTPITQQSTDPHDVAMVDQTMDRLIAERRRLETDYEETLKNVGEGHRFALRAKNRLDAHDGAIQAYLKEWLEKKAGRDPLASADLSQPETLESLLKKKESLSDQRDKFRQASISLGNKRMEIEGLRKAIESKRNDVDSINKQLERMMMDSKVSDVIGGRIELILPDSVPAVPTVDARAKTAGMGIVGGAGVPIAAILCIGLLGRRYRYSDEATDRAPSNSLLGILPRLPKDLSDPEQTAAAAHCVHQIRTLLQVGGADRKIYAITSSTPGDGKTSLTHSLGLSFAASGARTLLLDLDLIGRGLSRGFKLKPNEGIARVLISGEVNGSIMPTQMEGLSILPAGRDDDKYVSRLSESSVRKLLDKLRGEYDVLLVDTGPILGSLEANFVSCVADGVVLVVGQGQERTQVQRAFEQLARLNARVLGFVFNLASATDFRRSAASASFRSVRAEPSRASETPKEYEDLDPLPRTVALDVRKPDEHPAGVGGG